MGLSRPVQREKDMKTSDLVEYASDPAFAVDGNMKVISWNAAVEDLLGYSSEEAIGQSCGQMLQALYPTGEPLCSALRNPLEISAWGAREQRSFGEMVLYD